MILTIPNLYTTAPIILRPWSPYLSLLKSNLRVQITSLVFKHPKHLLSRKNFATKYTQLLLS